MKSILIFLWRYPGIFLQDLAFRSGCLLCSIFTWVMVIIWAGFLIARATK